MTLTAAGAAASAPEPVWRVRFDAADRMAVQAAAARAVETDPAPFFARFVALPQSLGGRFVSADTFKETFDVYRGNPVHRIRCVAPLHNASAVLASAWLRRVLQLPRERERGGRERNVVALVTGIPGAGKTASVLAAASVSDGLPPGAHAIYEGQLAKPEIALTKVREVLDAGFRPVIVALHLLPERALANTLWRFAVAGRGASIRTMARIQGGLPDGLAAVRAAFGDAVALRIIDRRDFDHPRPLAGWAHLPVLTSEGNREHIQKRLERHLDALRERLPIAAWRQASGLPPE